MRCVATQLQPQDSNLCILITLKTTGLLVTKTLKRGQEPRVLQLATNVVDILLLTRGFD